MPTDPHNDETPAVAGASVLYARGGARRARTVDLLHAMQARAFPGHPEPATPVPASASGRPSADADSSPSVPQSAPDTWGTRRPPYTVAFPTPRGPIPDLVHSQPPASLPKELR